MQLIKNLLNCHVELLGALGVLPAAMPISAAPCFSKLANTRSALAVQILPVSADRSREKSD
jgi:hypothetical protein